jgi:hypothetical protein
MLLQSLGKMPSCFGELVSPLVEPLLQIGIGRTAAPLCRRRGPTLERRSLAAPHPTRLVASRGTPLHEGSPDRQDGLDHAQNSPLVLPFYIYTKYRHPGRTDGGINL